MSQIHAAIIGGAGYTGGEMIRLLLRHPKVKLQSVHSSSNAGKPLYTVHKDLLGETELIFSEQPFTDIDVLFLCVGHGDAKKFLEQHLIPDAVKIIDLSQDFRLPSGSAFGNKHFVYGLPELNREQIKTAQHIANPGCFATAIQLALLPLAQAGILSDVYTTGITGSTGAGQSLSNTSHFSWRANNIQAYKSLNHQHIKEITASINQLQKDSPLSDVGEGPGIHFVPWRGDFTRGIYTSSTVDCSFPLEEVNRIYNDYYNGHAFTFLSESMIDLKQVVNTNKCLLHIEKQGNKLIIHSAIDNLLKGASGQAVQNMNLMFGLDEKTGLDLKANYF
jgi:N-acetyl-gamma-glutamyl-phosphate reductase